MKDKIMKKTLIITGIIMLLLTGFNNIKADPGDVIDSFSCSNAWDIAYDGNNLWIASMAYEDNMKLEKIDTETGNILDIIDCPRASSIHGLTWDGAYIWAADYRADLVYQIDVEKSDYYHSEIIKEIHIPFISQKVEWDGEYIWVAGFKSETSSEKLVCLIDPETGKIEDQFNTELRLAGHQGFAFDGEILWQVKNYQNGNPGMFFKYDKKDFSYIDSFSAPITYPLGLAFGDGVLWLVGYSESTSSCGIYKVDVEGSNNAPNSPNFQGPSKGNINKLYDYTISTDDTDNENIYYYIDWGNGENTGWVGPYESGEKCEINHVWDEQGNYIIRAKAKDINDAESDWTEYSISMPKTIEKTKAFSLIKFFQRCPKFYNLVQKFFRI